MGRPCPPTTQGDFRQTRAFSLRLPARSCRRGAPAATSTAAKHTPHRPHTHGPATKYRDIDRTYEKDVMFPIVCRCTPLGGTASMAHAYHTATALIDSRKSGVLALRSSCLPNLVTSVRRAARPSTSARARTPTAAQTHRRPTSGQCTVVLKYRARRLGGFPFRQLEGEADGETGESREGRRSLPHRLHGRTREAMAGAAGTRRQPAAREGAWTERRSLRVRSR